MENKPIRGFTLENNMNRPNQNNTTQSNNMSQQQNTLKDYGPVPVIFDMEAMTKMNTNFRTALWTGEHFQLTLMRSYARRRHWRGDAS